MKDHPWRCTFNNFCSQPNRIIDLVKVRMNELFVCCVTLEIEL